MFEDDLEYYIDEFERRFADKGRFDHNLRLRDDTSYYVPFYEPDGVKQFIMLTGHDSFTDFDYAAGTILYMCDKEIFIYMRPDCRGRHIMSNFMKSGILKEVFPDLKSCTVADDGNEGMLAARIALVKMAGLEYTVVKDYSRFEYSGRESQEFSVDGMRDHLVEIAENHGVPFYYSSCDKPGEISEAVCRALNYMSDDEIFRTIFDTDTPLPEWMDELISCFGDDSERIADKAACLANYEDVGLRSGFEKYAVKIMSDVYRLEDGISKLDSVLRDARSHGYDFVREIPDRVLPGSNEAYCRCRIASAYLDTIRKQVRDLMEDYYAHAVLGDDKDSHAVRMASDLQEKAWEESC